MIILKTTEEFRCETEEEAKELVEEMKEKSLSGGYEVTGWSATRKDKKSKGEIIDSAYLVKITKIFGTMWE